MKSLRIRVTSRVEKHEFEWTSMKSIYVISNPLTSVALRSICELLVVSYYKYAKTTKYDGHCI